MASADPAPGLFWSFLLAGCGHFLAHERKRDAAARRGGSRALLSINASDAEEQYQTNPVHEQTPERFFERDRALALLEGVVAVIRPEYNGSGRGASFEILTVVLEGLPVADRQKQLQDQPSRYGLVLARSAARHQD